MVQHVVSCPCRALVTGGGALVAMGGATILVTQGSMLVAKVFLDAKRVCRNNQACLVVRRFQHDVPSIPVKVTHNYYTQEKDFLPI